MCIDHLFVHAVCVGGNPWSNTGHIPGPAGVPVH